MRHLEQSTNILGNYVKGTAGCFDLKETILVKPVGNSCRILSVASRLNTLELILQSVLSWLEDKPLPCETSSRIAVEFC